MGYIKLLSEKTVNQIAAGEVVENPASVVKELIENSLDAKASRVVIEVKGGGFQLIRISDDGCGMDRDDAVLSLKRHATSKIYDLDDLQSLETMGFRGEALASIGAISHLTLITAQEEGIKVGVEGGKMVDVSPSSRSRGTTIEIKALFYNVPARKKFQKSAQASNGEIYRVVTCLSLAHPEIAFELINNDAAVFSTQPLAHAPLLESLRFRIKQVLGEEFAAIPIELEDVVGFLGTPQEARSNRKGQYLFVNKRAVVSSLISYAVREGYGTRIDVNRYPTYVLHLKVPSKSVDVNVHPQKKEVRFQDEAGLKRKVFEAVSFGFRGGRVISFEPSPISFSLPKDSLVFREETFIKEAPFLFENEPVAIGLWDHFLLLDAASIEGYGSGVVVVDLLATQEEMAFSALQHLGKPIPSQRLLLPVQITLSALEIKEIITHLLELEKVGFSLNQMGKEVLCVDAIPTFLPQETIKEALLAVVHEEDGKRALARFARRQKKVFVLQEALALWKQVKWLGKPITTYLSYDAVTKLFTS